MAGSPKTADEVWSAVRAEIEAMHAPFGVAWTGMLADQQTENLMRIAAVTGWRLAQEDCAERIERAAIHG